MAIITSTTSANGNSVYTLTASVCLCDSANATGNNAFTDVYLPTALSLITDCTFAFNTPIGSMIIIPPSGPLSPVLQWTPQAGLGMSAKAFKPIRYLLNANTWSLFEQTSY